MRKVALPGVGEMLLPGMNSPRQANPAPSSPPCVSEFPIFRFGRQISFPTPMRIWQLHARYQIWLRRTTGRG